MTLTIPPRTNVPVVANTSTTGVGPTSTSVVTAVSTPVAKPIDGVDTRSGSQTGGSANVSGDKQVGNVVVPLINEKDLQQALAVTSLLSASSNPSVAATFTAAADAAARLAKAVSVEVPIRLQVTTGKSQQAMQNVRPTEIPGMLREQNGVVTFYPSDEALKPFDVDAASAQHLPKNTLLLAKSAKKQIDIALPDGSVERAPLYNVGQSTLQPARAAFIGVVDNVGGEAFVRDLVPPPRMLPLEPRKDGSPWADGAIVDVSNDNGRAVVGEVKAEANTPKSRTWMVAGAQRLDPTFTKAALDEAKQIEKLAPTSLADASLVDMTKIPFFAIDNDNSKDIDQAMHLEKRADGGYVLSYALADAAHYIKPGSVLFEGAMQRGASYYLPGLSIPMLPENLSEGVISLNAHEDHRAMVLQIRLDKDGNVEGQPSVLRAKIHSQAQITYNGVSAELEGRGKVTTDIHGKAVPQAVSDQLKIFEEIGSKRMAKARERGVVDPDRREMQIGSDQHQFFLKEAKSDCASKLNAELSILANVAGAQQLDGSKIPGIEVPGIYKVHAEPKKQAMQALWRQVKTIVAKNGLPATWAWQDRKETVAAWVDRIKKLPAAGPAGDRERALSQVLQMTAVRVNVSSGFDRNPGKHSGLQLDHYGRFSAPMREQVGVVSHAVLFAKDALERAFDAAKLTPAQAQALWAPLLLGATVDPNKIPPARRALAAEAQQLLTASPSTLAALATSLAAKSLSIGGPLTPEEYKLINEVMDRATTAGNTSKMKQGQVEGAGMKLVFDDIFMSDLNGNPLGNLNAPKREGTVTSVTPAKVYIQLKDPDVEVRLSMDDLKRNCPGSNFHLEDDGVSLVGDGSAAANVARLLVGQSIKVQATHHDGDKLHFAVVD